MADTASVRPHTVLEENLHPDELANLKLLQGMVFGAMAEMAERMAQVSPTAATMLDDDEGNHTGLTILTKASGRYLVSCERIRESVE